MTVKWEYLGEGECSQCGGAHLDSGNRVKLWVPVHEDGTVAPELCWECRTKYEAEHE